MTEPVVEAVRSSAGLLNGLLVAGAGLAVVIVALKILKRTEFDFKGIKLTTNHVWAIFLALSLAHIYLTYSFVTDCVKAAYHEPPRSHEAWDAITSDKALFFHGIIARTHFRTVLTSGGRPFRLYSMDARDPTTWLVHGVAILVFVAIVRIRRTTWLFRVFTLSIAAALVFVNWIVGSNWVVAASELTLPQQDLLYLAQVHKALGI